MTMSACTISATCAEEGEKSCGSAPIGIKVVTVEPVSAQMAICSATLPSMVVVATTVTAWPVGAEVSSEASSGVSSLVASLVASSAVSAVPELVASVEESSLEHAVKGAARARAAAGMSTSREVRMGRVCA